MVSYFYRALDVLAPLAREAGTRLLIENMPFAFLPDAESLMNVVDGYGDAGIRVIYDVANAHFIGEAPTEGLRRVRDRLSLVHFSDTTRQSYKHDPLAAETCRSRACIGDERDRISRAADAGSHFAQSGCRHRR